MENQNLNIKEDHQSDKTDAVLCQLALKARLGAYAPYSHRFVGAAVETDDGQMYTGCNIENASFSATICAERTAIAKAVSEGHRKIRKIAVCGGVDGRIEGIFPPCGICRQIMTEFGDENLEILLISNEKPLQFEIFTLEELLPLAFAHDHFENEAGRS